MATDAAKAAGTVRAAARHGTLCRRTARSWTSCETGHEPDGVGRAAGMNKLLRLIGTGILILLGIRVLDLFLSPALPLLIASFFTLLSLYVAVSGFRQGL
jgi:hypothetical protein